MPAPIRSRTQRAGLLAATACVVLAVSAGALAFSSGPPDGFAGDPPLSRNCTLCHVDYEVNSGNGSLALLNLPSGFVAGQTYDLQVKLEDPGQMRWGFELTVLGADNQQAGTLAVTDVDRTQLSDNPGTAPDYLKHTETGTDQGVPDGPTTWSFRWTAPDATSVTFYVAGNAADGTFDPGNDYIYTIQKPLEGSTIATMARSWSAVKSLYRDR